MQTIKVNKVYYMFIYKQPCKAHLCLNKNKNNRTIHFFVLKANMVFVLKYILIQVCLVLDTERRPQVVDVQSTQIIKKNKETIKTLYDVNSSTSLTW